MLNAAEGGGGGGSYLPILMIVLLFGVMYFMMIRPQQKRRREAEQMQSSIGPGDEVVTIGGLYGTVTSVDDETVMLEVAPGVQTRYARPAIARVVSSTQRSGVADDESLESEAVSDDDALESERPGAKRAESVAGEAEVGKEPGKE